MLKRVYILLKKTRVIAKTLSDETYQIKNDYMNNNPICIDKEVDYILNNVLVDIMKHNFITELNGEG